MRDDASQSIFFRGRRETVREVVRVRGRSYSVLEKLSHRGAYRVFDRSAGPDGDYRVLYRLEKTKSARQKIDVLRRMTGPTANRNFPTITDFHHTDSELIVVLSWVWGISLDDFLAKIRESQIARPVAPEVVRLIRGLTHGLAHYHRRSHLIHGDVTPANILLTSNSTQLVLVDFGAAWPIQKTASKEIGDGVTLPYAAPERLTEKHAGDFRGDVFSLAVVAYELLTMKIPYDGLGGQADLPPFRAHCENALQAPSGLLHRNQEKRLPRQSIEKIDAYFSTALALEPENRFATTSDWLRATDELHGSIRDQPVRSASGGWLLNQIDRAVEYFASKRN